jgi:hypothetical protein
MRPVKITFGEMRSGGGPTGILVYCADYRCSHSIAISDGTMTCGSLTLSRASSARRAASAEPMCDRISRRHGWGRRHEVRRASPLRRSLEGRAPHRRDRHREL